MIKRLSFTIALIFILSGISLSQNINFKQKNRLYFFIGCGIDWKWDIKMCRISSIPEFIRNVPIHPDDLSIGTNIAPIDDATLKYSPVSASLGGLMGIGYNMGSYNIKAGGSINYYLTARDKHALKERNYTNAPGTSIRDEKAALTYYKLDKNYYHGKEAFVPGFFLRLSKQMKSSSCSSIFLEYNLTLYSLHIENGWDRYNRLEGWKIYKIANIIQSAVKIGLELKVAEIFIQYTIPSVKLTEVGKTTEFIAGPHLAVGFSFKILT